MAIQKINPGQLLIERFCDLYTYDRNFSTWSYRKFRRNTPRLLRYKMVLALFRILGINRNFEQFYRGEFIKESYTVNDLIQLLLLSNEDIEQLYYWISTGFISRVTDNFMLYHAMFNFEYILEYRLKLEELYQCNSGKILMSAPLFISSAITGHVETKIQASAQLLDQVLAHFINPSNMETTMEVLQKVYGYPSEKLEDIDTKWM